MSEYEGNCSYMNFLLANIEVLANLDYQRRLWIEGIPDKDDSWEERMCLFFDSANIDGFLEDLTPESHPEYGLSQIQIDELWKLRNKADHYCSLMPKYIYTKSHDVLADPRWHEVVACAQETLKAFEGY